MLDAFYAPVIDGQLGRWTRLNGSKPEHEVFQIALDMGYDREYIESRLWDHGSITFQYKHGHLRYAQQ